MPRGDGTGPVWGSGPGTGRGRGAGAGRGAGRGAGAGRGRGRGMGMGMGGMSGGQGEIGPDGNRQALSGRKLMAKAVVDEGKCTGCGICVDACPPGAISMDGTARISIAKCTGCGACVEVCLNKAITLNNN